MAQPLIGKSKVLTLELIQEVYGVICQIIETEVGYRMVLLLTLGERW